MNNPPSMVPRLQALEDKLKASNREAGILENNLKNISTEVKGVGIQAASLEGSNHELLEENENLKAQLSEINAELESYVDEKNGLVAENADLKIEAMEWKQKYLDEKDKLDELNDMIVRKRDRQSEFPNSCLEVINRKPSDKRPRTSNDQ
jgi:chromosome segregation ATPase